VVQSGIAQVLLDPEQVVLVEKDESLCFVYTSDKKRYVFSGSLDLLSQQLPSQRFFRTNRQTITHRSNCHSFTSERSGKLVLVLHYPSAKTITISQKKAREFKQWLSISHGLKKSSLQAYFSILRIITALLLMEYVFLLKIFAPHFNLLLQ